MQGHTRGGPAGGPGFPLDDHLVVIGRQRDRLHLLNPVARFIREASLAGAQAGEIARVLSACYGIPPDVALRDVQGALEEQAAVDAGTEIRSDAKATAQEITPAPPLRCEAAYRIADQAFVLRCGSAELFGVIDGLLAHLRVAAPGGTPKVMDVWGEDGCFYVLNEGQVRLLSRARDIAVLGVVREVAELAYRGRDWLTVCHACAIVDGTQCIVMPASSGGGKSTLAAALCYDGWTVMSDDVVPVDRGTHAAVSVPIPFNLKSASFAVLSRFDSSVDRTPGFERGDGTIHCLVPRTFREAPPAATYPVRLLVYPRYQPGAEAGLRRLSQVESFRKLIRSDCMLPLPLEDDLVAELVEWMGGLPAYELVYGRLEDACAELAGIRAS
jgi:hypothetical protein